MTSLYVLLCFCVGGMRPQHTHTHNTCFAGDGGGCCIHNFPFVFELGARLAGRGGRGRQMEVQRYRTTYLPSYSGSRLLVFRRNMKRWCELYLTVTWLRHGGGIGYPLAMIDGGDFSCAIERKPSCWTRWAGTVTRSRHRVKTR